MRIGQLLQLLGLGLILIPLNLPLCRGQLAPDATLTTVGAAYGTTDINSCSVDLNNLVTATVGGTTYQFVAYYDNSGDINIARRSLGSSTWTDLDTNINIVTPTDGDVTAASLLGDDHNTIAMAVDSTGDLNMSFGMHNVSLNYDISNASVMGSTGSFLSTTFTAQTSSNSPVLINSTTSNEATYPDFYNIPGSSDLLFAYRNGGSGGGSGNGDEYFNVYDPVAKTWTNTLVINGEKTSVNAYLNNLVYAPNGQLEMSWTWRATPNWQTNSNIMYAQSSNNGTSWSGLGGADPYTLPIIQSGNPRQSDGQVVQTIPEGDSFINQTSMTADASSNPIIATYYAPGWNATSATAGSGNPNRQYMLVYYDGTKWRTSQISDRTSDTAVDYSGDDVRDLGRPIVVVDKQGRVLVVTRSEDTAMGSYSNPATPNNDLVVYYNTVSSLDSATPAAWQSLTLDTTNMGELEPTYDAALWNGFNELDLMFEPVGFSGEGTATLQVLDWNEQAYFASLPEPGSLGILAIGATALLRRRRLK